MASEGRKFYGLVPASSNDEYHGLLPVNIVHNNPASSLLSNREWPSDAVQPSTQWPVGCGNLCGYMTERNIDSRTPSPPEKILHPQTVYILPVAEMVLDQSLTSEGRQYASGPSTLSYRGRVTMKSADSFSYDR